MSTLQSADLSESINVLGLKSSIIDTVSLGQEAQQLYPLIEQIRLGLAYNTEPYYLVSAFKEIINHDKNAREKRGKTLISSSAFNNLKTPPTQILFDNKDLSSFKFSEVVIPTPQPRKPIAEIKCLNNVSFVIFCDRGFGTDSPYYFQISYTHFQGMIDFLPKINNLGDHSSRAQQGINVIKQLTSYLLDAQLMEAAFHEGGMQSLKTTLEKINRSLPKPPEKAIRQPLEPRTDTPPPAPAELIKPVEGFKPVVGAALSAVREELKTRGLYDDGQIANAFQLVSNPSLSTCWDDIYNKLMAGKILDPSTYITNLTQRIDQETLIRFKTDLGIPLSGPIPDDKVSELTEARKYRDMMVQTATAVLMMHVLNNQHTINTAFLPLTDTRLRISQYLDLVTEARFAQLAQSKLTAPINKDALKADIFHGLMRSYLEILPQEEMAADKKTQLKKISGI